MALQSGEALDERLPVSVLGEMSKCEFFYDFSSPFSYLGATQVERITAGHELVWKPMLLGALFSSIGSPIVPLATWPETKARHALYDAYRWADHWGVRFQWPKKFPQKTVTSLRAALAVEPARIGAVSLGFFEAMWVHDQDLEDDTVVAAVLRARGLDADAILAETKTAVGKQRLFATTEEAGRRGIPGAPAFIVDEQIFWGQDRLHFVQKALEGWRPKLPIDLATPR